MRVGASLLIERGVCIQSYSWREKRPLGSLQVAVEALEEYECDEVAIIRPVRERDSIDLFKQDLEVVRKLRTSTPISFGGGIRSTEHLSLLEGMPIERVIYSSAFLRKNNLLVRMTQDLFGRQAVQCILPIRVVGKNMLIYECESSSTYSIDECDLDEINETANEVIIYDVENEGQSNAFNEELVEKLPFANSKLVITGGVGHETVNWARRWGFSSVLIDNKVLHKEYSVKGYKNFR
jgi:phosphoribosylformimino-5-aminoimidazole carboxamide ribonucleotide (ProFAR) isomerase